MSEPDHAAQDKFLSDVFQMCMSDVIRASRDCSGPVIRFKTPEELMSVIEYDLGEEGEPEGNGKLLELCGKIVEHSMKTGHPHFFNQMYGGSDPYGFAANIIVDALNTNGHTFEVAPAFSVAEKVVIDRMLSLLDFHGEGTFCPGGSYCGLLAMAAARTHKFPRVRREGMVGLEAPLAVFCSAQAHYSAQKNAAVLGLGLDHCHAVKCDARGKMIDAELEAAVERAKSQGEVPLMVIATAGTTVMGAFDNFNFVADLCARHHMWMHVDGAWGGSALLSDKYRHFLDGAQRADSFAWNPHKLLQAPIQSSVLLFKNKGMLAQSQNSEVKYLFQNDKPYDMEYDLGRNLLQCGRSCDAFKLWLMWKAKGDRGLGARVETAWDNSHYLLGEVKKRAGRFILVSDEIEGPNVCFWFVPPSMREQPDSAQLRQKLARIVPKIKNRLQKSGKLMVGYAPAGDNPTFFRMVLVNDNVRHHHLDYLLDQIELEGADL